MVSSETNKKNSLPGRLGLPLSGHPRQVEESGSTESSSSPSSQNLWTHFVGLNNNGKKCSPEQAVSRLHF